MPCSLERRPWKGAGRAGEEEAAELSLEPPGRWGAQWPPCTAPAGPGALPVLTLLTPDLWLL